MWTYSEKQDTQFKCQGLSGLICNQPPPCQSINTVDKITAWYISSGFSHVYSENTSAAHTAAVSPLTRQQPVTSVYRPLRDLEHFNSWECKRFSRKADLGVNPPVCRDNLCVVLSDWSLTSWLSQVTHCTPQQRDANINPEQVKNRDYRGSLNINRSNMENDIWISTHARLKHFVLSYMQSCFDLDVTAPIKTVEAS